MSYYVVVRKAGWTDYCCGPIGMEEALSDSVYFASCGALVSVVSWCEKTGKWTVVDVTAKVWAV